MQASAMVARIADPTIRQGVQVAIEKTVLPAATERGYPGHFTVTADGTHYGAENTWPGLDSWQLAGTYLLLGRHQLVRNYFAFVRGSQQADGNIPFAIFPADEEPDHSTFLRGLRWPEDIYTYTPPGGTPRQWIGLFDHWQLRANPLSVLAPICYLLTAAEIFADRRDPAWLVDNLPSVEAAAEYLVTRRDANGLIGGAGFYTECPPRDQWDGVTQCYTVKAWHDLAALARAADRPASAARWTREAEALATTFRNTFWRDDHFAEYVHPTHGVVDSHGLSDTNWAAVAFDLATADQAARLRPGLLAETALWQGGMPTQTVALPATYAAWEHPEPLPFPIREPVLFDAAAMGRVWWLETQACLRLGATERVVEGARRVAAMGLAHDGWWHERYHVQADGSVAPAGPHGYCEYAAILTRVVLGNPHLFIA